MAKSLTKQPIVLLKSSFDTIINNPVILLPFTMVAFIQLLILEIIFFAPRYPLSIFFAPLIRKLEGEIFLHYPFNFVVMTKWFQSVQIPVYIILNSFFIGMTVLVIDLINNEKKVNLGQVFRQTLSRYVHLLVASGISVVLMYGVTTLYSTLLIRRALMIRSTNGIFYMIKRAVLDGAPYFNLLFAIFLTALFAFVVPLIVLERKKIVAALVLNFKYLWRSFWFIFLVILLPGLLYIPVLLLKTNGKLFETILIPEVWGLIIIFSIMLTLFIDAIQYAAITTYYLLTKETK